jgi:hypothetical protein
MHLIKFIARNTAIILAAGVLSAAAATDTLAAGRAGVGHVGGFHSGHMHGGMHGPLLNSVPSPGPTFNPSSSYTVPQSRETPVSPASPGSMFRN